MTDDDLLELIEPGCEYTREQIYDMVDVHDSQSKKVVSQQLGRLRSKGKLYKSQSGAWHLPTKSVEEPPKAKSLASIPLVKTNTRASSPVKSEKPTVATPAKSEPSIHDALLKVQAKLNGLGVDSIDDKLYTLQFLGKLLDPTIDKMLQSIADDLKRMNG